MNRRRWVFGLVWTLGLGLVGWGIWKAGQANEPTVVRTGFQGADVVPGLEDQAEWGMAATRLIRVDSWQRAQVPLAMGFSAPAGARGGQLAQRTEAADESGFSRWSELGVGAGSLAAPVFAVADGLVLNVRATTPERGGCVVLGHRLADGRLVRSEYQTLDEVRVRWGTLVARGAEVGTMGTGGGRWDAGVDFAMFEGLAAAPSSERAPEAVDFFGLLGDGGSAVAPLALILAEELGEWSDLAIENPELMPGLAGEPETDLSVEPEELPQD